MRRGSRAGGARWCWLSALALGALGLVLFWVLHLLSARQALNSDAANAVLQGESIIHGDWKLRGWTTTNYTFLPTELPIYAVAVAVRGVGLTAAHIVNPLLYAISIVLGGLLAARPGLGREAWGRGLLTAALMLAPLSTPAGARLLVGTPPEHVGTLAFVLAALVVLDRVPGAAGLALFGLIEALATLADPMTLFVGAAPVLGVAALAWWRGEGDLEATGRRSLAVAGVAALAAGAAVGLTHELIHAGVWSQDAKPLAFASLTEMPTHVWQTVEGVFVMYGADFFSLPLGRAAAVALLHLAGLAFAGAAVAAAVRSWGRQDWIVRALLLGIALDLAAFAFSTEPVDIETSRYLCPVIGFGAALAGRVGWPWLKSRRAMALVAVLALANAGLIVPALLRAPEPSPEAPLAAWLQHHGLRYGLAGYWQASSVTLLSGEVVKVRAVAYQDGAIRRYLAESQASWYDPSVPGNNATFLVLDPASGLTRQAAERQFGQPAEVDRPAGYTVLVYGRTNLLTRIPASAG